MKWTLPCIAIALLAVGCGDGPLQSALSNATRSITEPTDTGGSSSTTDTGRIEGYIRGDLYTRLVIELDVVEGHGPRDGVTDEVASRLANVLDKPDGVVFIVDQTLATNGDNKTWTFEQLQALSNDNFSLEVSSKTIKMHAVFVDGSDADDDNSGKTLGVAWANRNLVMFKDSINSSCSGGILGLSEDEFCTRAETAVLQHEVGHVLGLVNNGLDMVENHEDPEHPHHDIDDGCVMYWAYNNPDQLGSVLGSDPAPDFCAPSKQDISAVK